MPIPTGPTRTPKIRFGCLVATAIAILAYVAVAALVLRLIGACSIR